jgi:hypothetical protein
MSELGKSEMRRWEREVRALFSWLPTVTITDDGVTPGHAVTSVLPDHTLGIALSPEMVPGRAVGLHEMCHVIQRTLQMRVDDMLALVQEAFAVRGFTTPVTAANLPLAFEQMASMLPEAFIGEWGGYVHPLYGLFPAAQSRQWFDSPASQKVRDWFLALATWKPSVPAGGTVAPPILATPVGPAPFALRIIDVRDKLPLVPAREVGRAAKSSITVHWNGPPIAAGADPLDVIKSDAWFHTSKDWSPEPGIQGGDGIMYHFLVAPDGRCFKTRDDDAVLWHCGSEIGNRFSYAVQVMVGGNGDGTGDAVTSQQYATLTALIAHLALEQVKPHKIWSGTACPGLELTAWVNRQAWKEDDMFTDEDRKKLNRLYDHAEAYEPLVWMKRFQQWLAKAIRSIFANADLSGPDVETGDPFKP